MSNHAARWIAGGREPRDFYELAGVRRFDPRRDEIVARLREVQKDLESRVNGGNSGERKRAEHIADLVRQGEVAFASEKSQRAYESIVLRKLRETLKLAVTSNPRDVKAIRQWLLTTQNIHAARLDELANALFLGPGPSVDKQGGNSTGRSGTPILGQNAGFGSAPPTITAEASVVRGLNTPARQAGRAQEGELAVPNQGREHSEAARNAPAAGRRVNTPRVASEPPPRRAGAYSHAVIIFSAVCGAGVVFVLVLLFLGRGGGRVSVVERSPSANREAESNALHHPNLEVDKSAYSRNVESPASPPSSSTPSRTIPERSELKNDATPALPHDMGVARSGVKPDPLAIPERTVDDSGAAAVPARDATAANGEVAPSVGVSTIPARTGGAATGKLPAKMQRQQFNFRRPVTSVQWFGETLLAIAGEGDVIEIRDLSTGAERQSLQSGTSHSVAVVNHAGKTFLASAGANGDVMIWNLQSPQPMRTIQHRDLSDLRCLTWLSAAEPQLIVGAGNGMLRQFSMSGTQVALFDFAVDAGGVQGLAILADSRPVIVSGHLDGTIVIWSLANRQPIKILLPAESAVTDALGKLTGGAAGSLEITPTAQSSCFAVAVHTKDRLLAVSGRDLELWELNGPRFLVRQRVLPGSGEQRAYRALAFSTDGAWLAAGNSEGQLTILNVRTWKVAYQDSLNAGIHTLAWHPTEQRLLAVGTEDGGVHIVPFGPELATSRVRPDFDSAKLIGTAQTCADNEEWSDCIRLLSVVSAFAHTTSERTDLDRLRQRARKAVQIMLNEIDPRQTQVQDLENCMWRLQLAIDLPSEPADPLGKIARDKLAKLPALTAAKFGALNGDATPMARPGPVREPPRRKR